MSTKLPNLAQTKSIDPLVKIGQAAKLLGVSIDTLRRWEKSGQLQSSKTSGGTRFYSTEQLKSLNSSLSSLSLSLSRPGGSESKSSPPNSATTTAMLKISEAAKKLGVSVDTLRRWERSGKISPTHTPGGFRLYSKEELDKFAPKAAGMVTIGQAVRVLGISKDTLRRWEQKGKLKASRTPSNYRLYSVNQLAKLKQGSSKKPEVQEAPAGAPMDAALEENEPGLVEESAAEVSGDSNHDLEKPVAKEAKSIGEYTREFPDSIIRSGGMITGYQKEPGSRYPDHSDLFKLSLLEQAMETPDQKKFQLKRIVIFGGSIIGLTVIFTSLITTSYLISPAQTKNFFAGKTASKAQSIQAENLQSQFSQDIKGLQNMAFSALSPFNSLATKFIAISNPTKAKELGFVTEAPVLTFSSPSLGQVLAATTPSDVFLEINTDTTINGNLTAKGNEVVTGNLTAPNIVNSITGAGSINVDNTNVNNPIISFSLPSSVTTGVNNISGGVTLKAGTDLTIASSSATLTFSDNSTLDSVTSRGASTSNTLTLSSSSNSITASTLTVTGGSINGTTIGASTPSTGAFSTLSTTGASVLGAALSVAGAETLSSNGAASTPSLSLTGTIFSGGSATTTKPLALIEPSGTTSTGWNTSGTLLGVNSPSSFSGYLLDLQKNGSSVFHVDTSGNITTPGTITAGATTVNLWTRNNGTATLSPATSGDNLASLGTISSGAITSTSTITGTTLNGTTGINTGSSGGTQRIDSSGNLVNIGTITSGLINSQTISSAANFTGTLNVVGNSTFAAGTFASTLTGSNGFAVNAGAVNITNTTLSGGVLNLSGLSASSISTSTNALTITSSNFNTTSTGINSTDIGQATSGKGSFTTLTSSSTTTLSSGAGSSLTLGNSTGSITLTPFTTAGLIHNNGSGVLSSSAVNLAGGSNEVTGTLPAANGGTGQSSYTTGDILYANSSTTLTKLGIGGAGSVLVVSSGIPAWGSSSGSSLCTDCLFTDPAASQTITPTSTTAIGLTVAQKALGSVDIFDVTNNGSTVKYLSVGSDGTLNLGNTGSTAQTINLGTSTGSSTINIGNNTGDTINFIGLTGSTGSVLCVNGNKLVTCATGTSTGTLQSDYNNGNTITTLSASDVAITLAAGLTTPTKFSVTNNHVSNTTDFYLNNANASGTNTNGILVEQTGAGTLTNGIKITQTAGAVTNALNLSGTFANLITSTNFSVTNAGGVSAASLALTTPLGISSGGVALGTTPTAGQLLIGTSGSVYALGSITNGGSIGVSYTGGNIQLTNNGVTSITGTANQVNASASTGGVTLSLPQSIATSSTPTFAGLTDSGLTSGSVLFAGTGGLLSQDNANFNYITGANATLVAPAITGSSVSGNALGVGPNALTNPTLKVDTSTTSAATGVLIKSAAAGGGIALSAISSGSNEKLTLDAKGSGNLLLQTVGTGNVGIGQVSPAGLLDISKAISVTPSLTGQYLSLSSSTLTDNGTAASGTLTNAAFNSIATPTLAATNTGVTTTNAYTLYLAGGPTAGTNETITNSYALGISGNAILTGIQPSSVSTTPGTAANTAFSITGGIGGNTSIATTGVGGIGGLLSLTGGAGGVANSATTADTGGKGGNLTFTTGVGGAAAATAGVKIGGLGGDFNLVGGNGGAASGAGTSNTGGAGGNLYLYGGIGGTASGATTNTAGANGNVLLAINSSGTAIGNVGIGTTSPGVNLDVNGTIRSTVTSGSAGLITGTSSKQWTLYPSGNDLRLFEYTSTFGSGGNDRVTFQAGGNVGIGTTSPGNIFNIWQANQASGANATVANSGINITATTYSNSTYWPAITFSVGNDNVTKTRLGIWGQMTNSGDSLMFGTNNNSASGINNTAMTINQNGDIGIGLQPPASTTQYALDISTPATSGATVEIAGLGVRANVPASTTTSSGMGIEISDAVKGASAAITNNYGLYVNALTAGGTNNYGLYVNAPSGGSGTNAAAYFGGNVGIGTTNPGGQLHIDATTNPSAGSAPAYNSSNLVKSIIENDGTTFAPKALVFETRGSGQFSLRNALTGNTNDFSIYDDANGASRLYIDNTGNIGLGTTTPNEALEVGGNVANVTNGNVLIANSDTNDPKNRLTVAGSILGEDIYQASRPTIINSNTYYGTAWTNWTTGVSPGCSTADSVASPTPTGKWKGAALRCIIGSAGNGIWANPTTQFTATHVYRITFRYTATSNFYMANRDDRLFTIPSNTGDPKEFSYLYTAPTSTGGNSCSAGNSCYLLIGADAAGTLLINELDVQDVSNGTNSYNFVADAIGNVGIGTTGPNSKLDVTGGDIRTSTQGNGFYLYNGTTLNTQLAVATGTNSLVTGSAQGDLVLRQNLNNSILMATNGDNVRMTINGSGNVGIGTTSPSNTLQVIGSICAKSTNAACAGSVAGDLYASNTTVQAADVAENYISSQGLEPGDVVTPAGDGNNQAIVKTTSTYQVPVIGVISTKPGVTLNSDATIDSSHPNLYPVALQGRVPIKVSTINGNISVGDLLTPSTIPGVAMKVTHPGPIIAKALDSYSNTNPNAIGKIMGFMNISFGDPNNTLANLTVDNLGNLIVPALKSDHIELSGVDKMSLSTVQGMLDPQILTQVGDAVNSGSDSTHVDIATTINTLLAVEVKHEQEISSLKSQTDVLSAAVASNSAQVASQSAQIASQSSEIASTSASLSSVNENIASISAQLAKGVFNPNNLTPPSVLEASSSGSFNNVNVSDTLSTLNLNSIDATVSGTLNVLTKANLASTNIAGDFTQDGTFSVSSTTGGNSINALTTLFIQNSTLAENVDFFNGLVTIDKTGTLKAQNISANSLSISGTTLGSAIIPAGQSSVTVSNSQVTSSSQIFTSPTTPTGGQALIISSKQPGTSFTVSLDHPYSSDIKFSWWIVDQK